MDSGGAARITTRTVMDSVLVTTKAITMGIVAIKTTMIALEIATAVPCGTTIPTVAIPKTWTATTIADSMTEPVQIWTARKPRKDLIAVAPNLEQATKTNRSF